MRNLKECIQYYLGCEAFEPSEPLVIGSPRYRPDHIIVSDLVSMRLGCQYKLLLKSKVERVVAQKLKEGYEATSIGRVEKENREDGIGGHRKVSKELDEVDSEGFEEEFGLGELFKEIYRRRKKSKDLGEFGIQGLYRGVHIVGKIDSFSAMKGPAGIRERKFMVKPRERKEGNHLQLLFYGYLTSKLFDTCGFKCILEKYPHIPRLGREEIVGRYRPEVFEYMWTSSHNRVAEGFLEKLLPKFSGYDGRLEIGEYIDCWHCEFRELNDPSCMLGSGGLSMPGGFSVDGHV